MACIWTIPSSFEHNGGRSEETTDERDNPNDTVGVTSRWPRALKIFCHEFNSFAMLLKILRKFHQSTGRAYYTRWKWQKAWIVPKVGVYRENESKPAKFVRAKNKNDEARTKMKNWSVSRTKKGRSERLARTHRRDQTNFATNCHRRQYFTLFTGFETGRKKKRAPSYLRRTPVGLLKIRGRKRGLSPEDREVIGSRLEDECARFTGWQLRERFLKRIYRTDKKHGIDRPRTLGNTTLSREIIQESRTDLFKIYVNHRSVMDFPV